MRRRIGHFAQVLGALALFPEKYSDYFVSRVAIDFFLPFGSSRNS